MSNEKRLKQDAVDIFLAGVAAVDPGQAVRSHLKLDGDILVAGAHRISLTPDTRVFVVGAGKAGAPMAAAVEKVLGNRVHRGLVVVKYGHVAPVERVEILEGGHPVPDEAGLEGALRVADLLDDAGEGDLVICLISGGGSSLIPSPEPPVTLRDKQVTTDLLLKGGGLARLAFPARVLALILSDVVADPLDVIASGPTVGDPTTFDDALAILDRYDLAGRVPETVLTRITRGAEGKYPDTPKPGDPELENVVNLLVGTNTIAIKASATKAREIGYNTTILSSVITGETRDAAESHAAVAREIVEQDLPVARPACVLSGGETTVTIKGEGKGGRNQEFALASAIGIEGLPRTVILSGGTDGTDGPTEAAGAIADGTTVSRARDAGLDPAAFLENNDSYHFFKKLDDLLITGPTLTNVMDLRVILVR
ncbi:MAG: glycerate kinase [bacterium]|nr:glycerate kinase [bacterium]